ncbi:MAG: DUF4249 domain-containing protein [Chitinophagaceae bacterium]|nr:MAG: DUF4249 domain-containing protein [Chitinophagaceae bacterium]
MKTVKYIISTLLVAGSLFSCREEYVPPAIEMDYNYLVVEGFINVSSDSSFFTLSRTQPPGENTAVDRESTASLSILQSNGTPVSSSVNKGNGNYALPTGSLATGTTYQLRIETADGKMYLSDPVTPRQTPEIDEVAWTYDPSLVQLNFTVSTHDNSNSTRYYRWEFAETWEYHANYNTNLKYNGDSIVNRTPDEMIYRCWSTRNSSDILIGSSAALSSDVISKAPLYTYSKGGNQFNVRQSMLVKQYALTGQAYSYWQSLKKMTETGGSIFDAQPTELIGNIRCITNPDEPVIGYLSAHTVTTKRIFVTRDEVPAFSTSFPFPCEEKEIGMTRVEMSELFGSGSFIPVYYGDGPDKVVGANRECADCTFYGGTTLKPTFW